MPAEPEHCTQDGAAAALPAAAQSPTRFGAGTGMLSAPSSSLPFTQANAVGFPGEPLAT